MDDQFGTHKSGTAPCPQFGRSYGVLIKEWRMLQRAVFVLDTDRRLLHAEYVDNQMQEPDYQAAVDAVRSVTI